MTEPGLRYLSASDLGVNNHICMLPCGGLSPKQQRLWSASDLDVYVSYISQGKKTDQLFGGFIFNGICTRDDYYIYPLYVGFGKPSTKKDWSIWIEQLFRKDTNLSALHETVRAHQRANVDVWVSIPYPHPFQTSFGKVRGRTLNFQTEADRFEAVRWWILQFLKRWDKEKKHLNKLNFKGFLWQREAIDPHDEPLVKETNRLLKTKQVLSMWLPNFGSYGVINWRKMGFDLAAVNANFYGNTSYDYQWVRHAATFAQTFHTGMQILYGKGLIYNETHLLDYLNLGLPSQLNYMHQSVLIYQFPNQTLNDIFKENVQYYKHLYLFTKGLYKGVAYSKIPYTI